MACVDVDFSTDGGNAVLSYSDNISLNQIHAGLQCVDRYLLGHCTGFRRAVYPNTDRADLAQRTLEAAQVLELDGRQSGPVKLLIAIPANPATEPFPSDTRTRND